MKKTHPVKTDNRKLLLLLSVFIIAAVALAVALYSPSSSVPLSPYILANIGKATK